MDVLVVQRIKAPLDAPFCVYHLDYCVQPQTMVQSLNPMNKPFERKIQVTEGVGKSLPPLVKPRVRPSVPCSDRPRVQASDPLP